MNNTNAYEAYGAREVDNFWDTTLTTDLWTGTAGSGGSGGDNLGSLYCYGAHGSNGTDSYNIRGKFNIKAFKYCCFYFSGYGTGHANTGDGGGSGLCTLSITDGTNSSTICQFGAACNTSSGSASMDPYGTGGYWITLTYDGTNINVRLSGWNFYDAPSSNGFVSYTSYNSVVADNTNINVSTWGSVYLNFYAQGTGNSSAGNADGGSGTGFCVIGGLTIGSRKFGSKGTE